MLLWREAADQVLPWLARWCQARWVLSLVGVSQQGWLVMSRRGAALHATAGPHVVHLSTWHPQMPAGGSSLLRLEEEETGKGGGGREEEGEAGEGGRGRKESEE